MNSKEKDLTERRVTNMQEQVMTGRYYKSYKNALTDGYRYTVWVGKDVDSRVSVYYAKNLQAALFIANAFARSSSVCNTAYADVFTTDPCKEASAFSLEYTRSLSCFSDEMTDLTYLHMFVGATL